MEAYILSAGEGREIDLGAFSMCVKAEGPGFSMLEATEPPEFGPPTHIHHDADEVFYVLEGEYVISIGDRERACKAGSFIYIPAGVSHGFRVGTVASRKLNIYVPGAMVGYFDALATATKSGDVTESELSRIAREANMEIVGPAPGKYV
jgi:mannose-6-phosphate isomerase-like protein (cupin superfamily)